MVLARILCKTSATTNYYHTYYTAKIAWDRLLLFSRLNLFTSLPIIPDSLHRNPRNILVTSISSLEPFGICQILLPLTENLTKNKDCVTDVKSVIIPFYIIMSKLCSNSIHIYFFPRIIIIFSAFMFNMSLTHFSMLTF